MSNASHKKRGAKSKGSAAKARPDLEARALALLKDSGVLNPNVTLDQIMSLSAKLSAHVSAARSFIYRDFLFRDC